jgi:hypothetical protein
MANYGRAESPRRVMMVRRAEFLFAGRLLRADSHYGEEADYCLRVPGRIVLHPRSAVRHERGRAAGPALVDSSVLGTRNRLLNAGRHYPSARSRSPCLRPMPSTPLRSCKSGAGQPRVRRCRAGEPNSNSRFVPGGRGARFVAWLDADAIIVDGSRDLAAELRRGRDLYLVEHHERASDMVAANTGVFMLRAGDWAESHPTQSRRAGRFRGIGHGCKGGARASHPSRGKNEKCPSPGIL